MFTITSGFEDSPITVSQSHLPSDVSNLQTARSWRNIASPSLDGNQMTFSNRRPFTQAEAYLDLSLGVESIEMFFKFNADYNGLQSYGKTDLLSIEVTNEAYESEVESRRQIIVDQRNEEARLVE
jgi:hypothetical protein